MKSRVGFGYDVHRFQEGRRLVLGGVIIDCPVGLLGHSDADVLIHAICDALLGAAALGDIGQHFPDTSPAFKDADSKNLLKKVCQLLKREGYVVGNVDCTLVMQKPKIAPYIPEMIRVLAITMQVDPNQLSIKATTSERLGFTGRQEGAAAYAVALIETS